MFDIGFSEIALIFVLGLLVLGPEKLPIAIKSIAQWIKAFREMSSGVQRTLTQELKINELQSELHKLGESTRAALNSHHNEDIQSEINQLKSTILLLQQQINGQTPNPSIDKEKELQPNDVDHVAMISGVPVVSGEHEEDDDLDHYADYDENDPIFLNKNCHPHTDVNLQLNKTDVKPTLKQDSTP